jgi:ribose transport system permease protein
MRTATTLKDAELSNIDREGGSAAREERLTVGALVGRLFSNTTSAITVVLFLICVVLSQLSPGFLTSRNLYAVLAQSAVVGVAAVGGTFVIITGGIDLSVGAAIGFAAMLGALSVQHGYGAMPGIFLTLLIGMGVGAINGLSVAALRLTPFIVTLATMGMAQGLTLQANSGQSFYNLAPALTIFGGGRIFGGLPISVIVTVIVFVLGEILLQRTAFGKSVYAVGGNREAARLAGIDVNRVTFLVYLLAGLCAGIAAVLTVGRVGAATHGPDGIRCNSLRPGYILSPMNEHQAPEINAALIAGTVLKRPGKAIETAYAALFLSQATRRATAPEPHSSSTAAISLRDRTPLRRRRNGRQAQG